MDDSEKQFANNGNSLQILNAFISKLPEGIVACDDKGLICLCNTKAFSYLVHDLVESQDHLCVIGCPITDFVNKNLIEHTLDEINEWLKQNIHDKVSTFIYKKNNWVIEAQTIPTLNSKGQFTGFVIIFCDITKQSLEQKKVESLLKTLSENARSPLASIRAAIEAMREFPKMAIDKQDQFKEIIYKESIVLSDFLNQASNTYAGLVKTKKSLASFFAPALFETIARRAKEKLGITLIIKDSEAVEDLFIKAELHSFVMAALFLLKSLGQTTGVKTFYCCFSVKDKITYIDIQWDGKPVKPEIIKGWENQDIAFDVERSNITLKDVLNHHHSALWTYFDANHKGEIPFLRFFIPVEEKKVPETIDTVPILYESQSQLSDLELFDQSVQRPGLDDRLLTELAYTSLIREINQARAIEEVIGKHSQLPRLIHSMIASGIKIRTMTWLVTAFSDAIVNKVFEFALKELGQSPVPFAFITLGSEGRKEQTLKTDQDNAIIYMDTDSDQEQDRQISKYFLKLGKKVCTWLDQAGYDYCTGNIMAKNPKWCQPLSVWKQYFTKWIKTSEPENLMHASIFFDFCFAYGEKNIVENLRCHLYKTLVGNTGYFRNMAINALHFRPPIGFFNNFITQSKGKHKKCLDIKKAITPIVDVVRVYALYNHILETNTQDRMHQLYLNKVFSQKEYNEIEQAYSFMMQIRFMGQIGAILGGKFKPDNFINPRKLSSIERKMLKEILKKIKLLQARLCMEFTGSKDCQIS